MIVAGSLTTSFHPLESLTYRLAVSPLLTRSAGYVHWPGFRQHGWFIGESPWEAISRSPTGERPGAGRTRMPRRRTVGSHGEEAAGAGPAGGRWLTIHEACAFLGVDQST